jgi:hypothetical protein
MRPKRGFWASRKTRQKAQIFHGAQIKSSELADGPLESASGMPKGAQLFGHNLLRNRG